MQGRFAKYLDNEKFIDWIAHPNQENERYWEDFVKENPEEKKHVELLKECLLSIKTKDQKLSDEEKQEILDFVLKKVEIKVSKPVFYLSFLKYAAVLIPIVGCGIYMFLNRGGQNTIEGNIESLLQVSVDSVSSTKLVLSDKSEISIEEEKSEINFGKSNNLIINNRDTLAISNTIKTESGEVVMNQLIVPYGRRSRLTLSDGTLVHVNSGSRLIFPNKFSEDKRDVFLSGEAFFEVKSETQRTFAVNLLKEKELSIVATGTKFNVNSYGNDDNVTTVLTEGEVQLIQRSHNGLFSKQKTIVMNPGELAEWSVSQKSVRRQLKVDTETYISWIEGLLIFNGETIENITSRLEKYYNIKIFLGENINRSYKLTGKLDLNDSIEETMENLSISASADFKKMEPKGYQIYK